MAQSEVRQAWEAFVEFVTNAKRLRLAEPVVPELERGWAGVFVAVRREELWCRKCGDTGVYTTPNGQISCGRCGSKKLVRAVDVLRSGEYRVEG